MNISFNESYITKNNKPWFPVMGEFHYTRYPKKYWKESLYKMKAGGIQVVSTYTIWIHHEEIQGDYDFVDNKDLREFIKTCKEVGILLFLRIGPWAHAEARNGGFPDWLIKKGYKLRTNDENYMQEVHKYYSRLFKEASGLLLKDNGPIVGIQIENEFGHCGGGLLGDDPEAEIHMKRLKKMAVDIGFDVPLYTATGWGGAATGGLIPVMGGYSDAPWDPRTTEIEPSGNFIFTHERNDHNIGSDYGLGHGITFDSSKFPFLTAELGGGLQVTRHRRPVAQSNDIGAMSLVKMGSGCNLLGYYMYHGGTNPKGKLTSLNESRDTGYPNDLNELNYDFRAPIREYGQISASFKEIKLLSLFVSDFGEELCLMPAYIPDENPLLPNNFTDLRYSIRHNGQWGFVFVNNYVRRQQLKNHSSVEIKTTIGKNDFKLNIGDVNNSDYFFYPINMPVNNKRVSEKITPLCKINDEIIFYGSEKVDGLTVISREDALDAYKISNGKNQQLIISNAHIVDFGTNIEVYTKENAELKVYPDFLNKPKNLEYVGNEGIFTLYKYIHSTNEAFVSTKKINDEEYEINVNNIGKDIYDAYLNINYTAEMADLYIDENKVADEFYCGETWQVGLRKFNFQKKFTLKLNPLFKDEKIYIENYPQFPGEKISCVNNISVDIIDRIVLDY